MLRVIYGEVSEGYRVKWADGRETLISPAAHPRSRPDLNVWHDGSVVAP